MQNELVERLIDTIRNLRNDESKCYIRGNDKGEIVYTITEPALIDAISSVLNEQPKYYDLCPKCSGQGIVSKPSYVAGDAETFTSSQLTYECNLCNGKMVIPIPVPLSISKQPRIDLEEVEKYLFHNSECGIEQRDEIRAMRNVPQKYRNEAYYQDLYDMESSPMVCTCGLDKILEDLEQFKKQKNGK